MRRAWRHPTATVQEVDDRRDFAADEAVGVAQVLDLFGEEGEAKNRWEKSFHIAVQANTYADVMKEAASKAMELAQTAQEGCKTAHSVAKETANLARMPFVKKRKHEAQEEVRKVAKMDDEDKKMKTGQIQIEENEIEGYVPDVIEKKIDDHTQIALVSNEAWSKTFELATEAQEFANRLSHIAAEAMNQAANFHAKCAEDKSACDRTAVVVETTLSKKPNREEQKEDGKKQMATTYEEDRKRNDEETRRCQRASTWGRSTSSTDRNEQQQWQQCLRVPRPPSRPPPRPSTTPHVRCRPSSWK